MKKLRKMGKHKTVFGPSFFFIMMEAEGVKDRADDAGKFFEAGAVKYGGSHRFATPPERPVEFIIGAITLSFSPGSFILSPFRD